MTDSGTMARTTVGLLTQAAAGVEADKHPGTKPDPRLIAAEVVAACALHLICQWSAWQALNAAALAAEEPTPANAAALMREAMQMVDAPAAMHDAMAAFELLDAAVRTWSPHSHPAVSLRTFPRAART